MILPKRQHAMCGSNVLVASCTPVLKFGIRQCPLELAKEAHASL